jgi:hypothetical protein
MKITGWCKTLKASLVAAGILLPSIAHAINIPLGDPSFESYVVPAIGYAYANSYRPTIPWVDDLDSPPGYTQDDSKSAWLYNSAYAEDPTNANSRAAPRTGNQAMHGLANYTAQKTSAVFEANTKYTFSVWAQNDQKLDNTNGLFMYIFDGTVPFSDANSLASSLTTAINQRASGMTPAQSQANWTQVSISLFVPPGASEIGHPIGVGFFARRDTAVDDATLTSTPEPSSVILVGIGMLGASLLGRRRQGN